MAEGWLPETAEGAEGDRPFDHVARLRPEYAAALEAVETALWRQQAIDPALLVLCQYRISGLLGAAPAVLLGQPDPAALGVEDQLAVLPRWPTDPAFGPTERTCLSYAEQLLLDASGVTDEQAAEVVAAVGQDGFVVLTYACGLFETRLRAELVLGIGR
jgi:alkylhydroperoxidase family enzyme